MYKLPEIQDGTFTYSSKDSFQKRHTTCLWVQLENNAMYPWLHRSWKELLDKLMMGSVRKDGRKTEPFFNI